MEFRTLHEGWHGAEDAGVWSFRTPESWQGYWATVHRTQRPLPEAPELRPDEMAVVVALGARGTAGYAVRIDRLVEEDGVLRVFATESRPGPDTATAQVLTHPFHAVATADRALAPRLALAVVEV